MPHAARYNPDGTLDQSFGVEGMIATGIGVSALVLQTDGQLIAAGGAAGGFALARYNLDGTRDISFGTGGQVVTTFPGGSASASAVTVQTDGQIVAAGTAYNPSADFAVARYNTDGTPDVYFGNEGRVTTDFDGQPDLAFGIVIQADGQIVLAGRTRGGYGIGARPGESDGQPGFALVRYLAAPTQQPCGGMPRSTPGRIEAEDYDQGGQAVAYFDVTSGNEGGEYRPDDDVDIKASGDESGGYAVGWFNAGEWLSYTVDIAQTGTYDIEVRVGSALPGRAFHIEVNGRDVTGAVRVPYTGEWDRYETVRISSVALVAGRARTVRVVMGAYDYMDLNWINVVPSAASAAR